jgi:xylitol oxidase
MKKREFIKLAGVTVAGAAINPIMSCSPGKSLESDPIRNWAGNLQYSSRTLIEPETLNDVVAAMRENPKLRVLGTRHCFNRIADTDAPLLSTARLNKIITIDAENWSVTVEGGARYGEFCQQIHEAGFAIHNLASLPHISVAGACATATHGSGVANGNLATNVSAVEIVKADGEVLNIDRNDPRFQGMIVSLGSLGVVTRVIMDLIPTFDVRQDVYLNLPVSALKENFREVMSAGYSVSLFTDWQTEFVNQVWIKSISKRDLAVNLGAEFHGAQRATRNVHPIIEIPAENCTDQMSVPGPWYERLPHFKMGFTPSSGEELQAEYFVPIDTAWDAVSAVALLREEIRPYILITEIRSIAADEFWMSPCYQQQSIAIHFTLKQDIEGVSTLLPKIEQALAPFGAKPHWGKLFAMDPAVLQSRYTRLEDFRKLRRELDPEGKLINDFIKTNLSV